MAAGDARRGRLAGIGMVNEGLCYNPIAYDFFFEQGWRDEVVDLQEWGRRFVQRRYGQLHPEVARAWELLIPAVYTNFQPERSEHYRINRSYDRASLGLNIYQCLFIFLGIPLQFRKLYELH